MEESLTERCDTVQAAIFALQKARTRRTVWDPASSLALKNVLQTQTDWSTQDFIQCLVHRFASPGRTSTQSPSKYLPSITDFFEAPLDRYKNATAVPKELIHELSLAAGVGILPTSQTSAKEAYVSFSESLQTIRENARRVGLCCDVENQTWGDFLDRIRKSINPHTFENWARAVTPAFIEPDGTLIVVVPTDDHLTVLSKNNQEIQNAARLSGLAAKVQIATSPLAERLVLQYA